MANVVTMLSGTTSAAVYASTARTATPDTAEYEFIGEAPRSLLFNFSVTAGAALSLTFKVEGVDRASGTVFLLLAGAAETGVTAKQYSVGPGLPVSANVSANAVVPSVFRVTVTHGNGTSCTYSLSMFTGS